MGLDACPCRILTMSGSGFVAAAAALCQQVSMVFWGSSWQREHSCSTASAQRCPDSLQALPPGCQAPGAGEKALGAAGGAGAQWLPQGWLRAALLDPARVHTALSKDMSPLSPGLFSPHSASCVPSTGEADTVLSLQQGSAFLLE